MSSPTHVPAKSAPVQQHQHEAAHVEAMPSMRPPTFQLEANPNAEVMRPEDKAKAKEALMSGALATSGAYETTPKFRFKDAGLQSVYEEVRGKFGLSDDALVETNTKPVAGDAPGKPR